MVQYIKNTKERLYVVGLVGPFGSGCSYVAEKIVENHGYEYLSLSAVLREEYKKEKPNKRKIERKELQDFGDNAPTYIETNMAIAYAASMRSSCLKRKVGAVIVDITEDVFSSGYNEVPAANF